MKIPDWLGQPATMTGCVCCDVSRGSFLNKTLGGLQAFFVETVFLEAEAAKDGLLQRVDPRVKVSALAGLLVLLSLNHALAPLIIVYAVILGLAVASRLDMTKFLKRTVGPAIFFSFAIILPATLNIVTPGRAALVLLSPAKLTVTYPGLEFASVFWLRALTMLTATILILRTTRIHRLFSALAALRAPNFAVSTLLMAYRYVFVLVGLIGNTHLARKSRTIKLGADGVERRWVAERIAWTLNRSLRMSDDVTDAMISRGWTGRYARLPGSPLTGNDWLAAGIAATAGAALIAVII
ncbi:MAG: cobalt ECF transporter T component CbiQ [Actinomycetota bacterium]|nr:cobalt ECF transporter T component CbiQ [Actinomycetota bacterium]